MQTPSVSSVEELLQRVTSQLHDLRAMGHQVTIQQRSILRKKVAEITDSLLDIKKALMSTVEDKLSQRQIEVLQQDQKLARSWAGWEAVFGKCINIGLNIRIYRQGLESAEVVDSLILALVLGDISRVGGEIEDYMVQVISGDGSLLSTGSSELAKSTVCLVTEDEDNKKEHMRYTKNKTEGLVAKISRVVGSSRSKSDLGGRGEKRSSLVGSISGLFKSK